eukprot:g21971.t1
MPSANPFHAESKLKTNSGEYTIYRLPKLAEDGVGPIDSLPFSIRVLLEACLRNVDGFVVNEEDVTNLANWNAKAPKQVEVPFKPGRVVLQDFTGVPAVVDLAALRSAMVRMGGDPNKINPLVPCDLVIDHSVQVDQFGSQLALQFNVDKEFERNQERYQFLRWGQQAFHNFRVIPPATGIVHQVNLEYLAKGVLSKDGVAYPDSLVGTDSHTTMINGLGVVGWGVGGIEAEAVMLGQPIYMLTPEVVGFKLTGELPEGATATDLVLTVTQMLRAHGVVGKFVEFYGPGLDSMSLPDRATLANMAPEYGATMGFFPVDAETLRYLERTGRTADEIDLVERYYKEQGMFRTADSPEPQFTSTSALDLSTVVPSLAGPKRPQDRIELTAMKSQWEQDLQSVFGKSSPAHDSTPAAMLDEGGIAAGQSEASTAVLEADGGLDGVPVDIDGQHCKLKHGSVVIAAITSCTNTSNPSVMVAAGLVARNAVAKGLARKPWVKTSLAPGSRVVTEYLEKSGLDDSLDALGFQTVGYGCTTCIGNSGPLPEPISKAVTDGDLVVASVLSGNRNFEGRISQQVKANYLASPPLVVAYAIAGTTDIDLTTEPLGQDADGNDVFLKDIWPSQKEVTDTVSSAMNPEMFADEYGNASDGPPEWQSITGVGGDIFEWDEKSTYIQEPPFFVDMPTDPPPIQSITGARVLISAGDSVTTDHISPAGAIKPDSPAGKYLQDHGVTPQNFNSYGSRRGNDRIMTRGTFANIRFRNLLCPGTEGGVSIHFPSGEQTSVYEAAQKYKADGTPLIALTGDDYGMGSSRDWAAKGTYLLGIRAVIATSYERIHRSNLVGMGVLPLQFRDGESREALGLDGTETFDIALDDDLKPRQAVEVTAKKEDGTEIFFTTLCRIDTPVEIGYYRHGGILHNDKPQPIWDTIVGTKPERFLFIGDNIYADTEDMALMRAKYAMLNAKPGYQRLKKVCPILATWDDHDYGKNDAGVEYPKKKESQQIFLDVFGVAKDSPRRKREGVYHAEITGPIGKRVQFILLDTRYFRSPLKTGGKDDEPGSGIRGPYPPDDSPEKTFLGPAQWKWLEQQLRKPAEIRILASSIQVVADQHHWEGWGTFPRERKRLFDLIGKTKANGVIIISGDRHKSEISRIDNTAAGYPIYDVTSSSLNTPSGNFTRTGVRFVNELNGYRVGLMYFDINFGTILIDWTKPDPVIRMQVRDSKGDVVLQARTTAGKLQPH